MKKNILIGDSQTHYLAKSLKETIHSIDYFKDSYFEDRTITKMINREYTNIQYKFNILDNNYELTMQELKHLKPAFSITYHRIQGQTINNKIAKILNPI